tara:strand:- start:1147 stop:2532 length:1386 start_codon:yes stop_codon:yes gene_type:complete
MVFPVVGGTQSTGYDVANGFRFNANNSSHFTRSYSATGNRKKFTISVWVKRSALGENNAVLSASTTNNFNDKIIGFRSSDAIEVNNIASGSDAVQIITNRLFRDTGAWMHIVLGIDTTQSSIDNGVKLYINGVREDSYDGTPVYTQDATFEIGRDGSTTAIGRQQVNSSQYFDGYIAEMHYVDDAQYDPSYFGETNADGMWVPKQYTGGHGTTGFFLEFQQTGTSANSSGKGADTSGNDNHFDDNNADTDDIVTDTPTNNFCTGSQHARYINDTNVNYNAGNLYLSSPGVATSYNAVGTLGSDSMPYYFEVSLANVDQNSDTRVGVVPVTSLANLAINGEHNQVAYRGEGTVTSTGETSLSSQGNLSDGTILGVAVDPDNNVKWYLNGSLTSTISINSTYRGPEYVPYYRHVNSGTSEWNFGNPSFSISSAESDENGFGQFEYAPPSGYYALCTKNLAEYS